MTSDRYVPTQAIREAVKGRETEVLEAVGVAWDHGAGHITCPYPDHADGNPSWRWNKKKQRAHCTCTERSQSIFDVVVRCENIDFEAAKLRVAEILGRQDLIKVRDGERHQAMDAASLLRPPADQRDDDLVRGYLAHRLGVAPGEVSMPSTAVAGWRRLPYYDPPARKGAKPRLAGRHACAVFATVAPDGRTHAHRIYVASDGQGKADLGADAGGRRRDPKKSAKLREGANATGCAVLWGDPATAPHLILAEGAETTAALALAHEAELRAGKVAFAAAMSTGGLRAFRPWPANRRVTIAADRDEDKSETDRGSKAGERAARDFARKHHRHLEVRIALAGNAGQGIDWLDVLRADGVETVRSAIAEAELCMPSSQDQPIDKRSAAQSPDLAQIEDDLDQVVERAVTDPGAPFEPEAVAMLASARHAAPAAYQRTIQGLKQAGTRLRDLDREMRRAKLRVIDGGGSDTGFEAIGEAGPYFVAPDGMIAWRKETREGVVPQPLCNFTARIVAEEVFDDGAEQRTVFVVEGALPGGRSLSATPVPAEHYPTMGWVTEAWAWLP